MISSPYLLVSVLVTILVQCLTTTECYQLPFHQFSGLKSFQVHSTPQEKSNEPVTSIFIANLPYSVTEDELKSTIYQKTSLKVGKIYLAKDKNTMQFRGFGFADMLEPSAAIQAVEQLHGVEMNGRKLICSLKENDPERRSVRPVQNRERDQERSYGARSERKPPMRFTETPEKSIYISNLNFAITKQNIDEMCADLIGPELVENIRFPIDRDSGSPKGFCYVTFKDPNTVDKAIEALNGVPVLGREIRVSRYQGRD